MNQVSSGALMMWGLRYVHKPRGVSRLPGCECRHVVGPSVPIRKLGGGRHPRFCSLSHVSQAELLDWQVPHTCSLRRFLFGAQILASGYIDLMPTSPMQSQNIDADPASMTESEFDARWRQRLLAAITAASLKHVSVATWLGLGSSGFSKRLRGEVQFTIYEFVRLSQRFSLPMTPQAFSRPSFAFSPSTTNELPFDPHLYLDRLHSAFVHFLGSGSPQLPPQDTGIRISSSDLPIFWFLQEPTLAALKLYTFEADHGALGAAAFDLADALTSRTELLERATGIAKLYCGIDSREVWGGRPLDSFLNVVLHLAQTRLLSFPDASAVLESLRRIVQAVCSAAAVNHKAHGGGFLLHVNAHHATNSLIGVHSPYGRALYLTFDNPHFLTSTQPAAHTYFEQHFENLVRRATPANGHGAYTARMFYDSLTGHIDTAARRLALTFEAHALARVSPLGKIRLDALSKSPYNIPPASRYTTAVTTCPTSPSTSGSITSRSSSWVCQWVPNEVSAPTGLWMMSTVGQPASSLTK